MLKYQIIQFALVIIFYFSWMFTLECTSKCYSCVETINKCLICMDPNKLLDQCDKCKEEFFLANEICESI